MDPSPYMPEGFSPSEDLTPLVEAHDSTIRSAKEIAEELLEQMRQTIREGIG